MPGTSIHVERLRNKSGEHHDGQSKNRYLVQHAEGLVSGDEPMTGTQRSYLKTLSEQAHQPEAYAEDLTKAEASKRIDELKQSLDLD